MNRQTRKRIYFAMTAYVLSASLSSSLTAQMSGNQFSPLNQLGRAWGIGIGDGYHECKDCPKAGGKGYGINALRASGGSSWYSKLNPFSSSSAGTCGVAGCTTCENSAPVSHTVLPPNVNSYGRFATPAVTPLPWSSAPPSPYQPSTIPSYNPSSNHSVPQPVPDPYDVPSHYPRSERDRYEIPDQGYEASPLNRRSQPTPASKEPQARPYDDAEMVEPRRMPDSGPTRQSNSPDLEMPSPSPNDDTLGTDYLLDSSDVPPPPALRKRQPKDKPLGEFPTDNLREFQVPQPPGSDEDDSLLPMDDESFDLVPNRNLPPLTQRRTPPTRYAAQPAPSAVRSSQNGYTDTAPRQDPRQLHAAEGYSTQPLRSPIPRSTIRQTDKRSFNR